MADDKHPHTAITTWSGFIYQGKVAIYYVAKILGDESFESDGCWLQLDSLEDFAIVRQDGAVLSLHQVKALKTGYFNSYKDELKKIQDKAGHAKCEAAWLHVAQNIADKEAKDIGEEYKPVQLYDYSPDTWCPVNLIDEKTEEKLKTILTKLHPHDASKHSDDYVKKVRIHLDQIVLKQVLKIHRLVHEGMENKAAAYTQKIALADFMNVLQTDLNQESIGDDYYFYIFLNDFFRYHQEYCFEDETLTEEELKKISGYMKNISDLGTNEALIFFQNLVPHREFKCKTLSDYKDASLTKEQLHTVFLPILQQLRQADATPGFCFTWEANEKSYSPTTILDPVRQTAQICNRIVRNARSTDLAVMFEGNTLITSNIDVNSIVEHSPDFMMTDESKSIGENSILNWKTVSLISLDKARDEIND